MNSKQWKNVREKVWNIYFSNLSLTFSTFSNTLNVPFPVPAPTSKTVIFLLYWDSIIFLTALPASFDQKP